MKLCLVVVGLVVVRSTVGVPSLSSHPRPLSDVRCMKTSQDSLEFDLSRVTALFRYRVTILAPGGNPPDSVYRCFWGHRGLSRVCPRYRSSASAGPSSPVHPQSAGWSAICTAGCSRHRSGEPAPRRVAPPPRPGCPSERMRLRVDAASRHACTPDALGAAAALNSPQTR